MTSSSHLCPHCGSAIPDVPDAESSLCPNCGHAVDTSDSADPAKSPKSPSLAKQILQTLLDPRSIQWLLMIGGGLSVLGLLIYLVSIGLFDNPLYAATALGLGSLALLGSGWGVVLKTRYRTAGQALTFLACVVIPLNLWFYDAQHLLQVEDHLWLAGLACCILYVATVYILKDPLFLYAVEAGVTLTVMLFLGHRGWSGHLSAWSVASLILGLCSLHLPQAFPAGDDEPFSRKRFGKPLFHSGLVQLIASCSILLLVQSINWFAPPELNFLGYDWSAGELIRHPWLAASLWLLAMYAWFLIEWQRPSSGLYSSLGIVSLTLAEVTLVAGHLHYEGAIAVMALTALLFHLWLALRHSAEGDPAKETEERRLSWVGLALLAIPTSLGLLLQLRALTPIQLPEHLFFQTGNYYLPVMLFLWGTTITSALISRHATATIQTLRHLLGAAVLLPVASEALRDLGYSFWLTQGVCLIPVAILYLFASRIRKGSRDEYPLACSAHASIATVAFSIFASALIHHPNTLSPVTGDRSTLLLGIMALEIASFYLLAFLWQHLSINLFVATAALVAAMGQFLGYFGISPIYYSAAYALLGLILLIAARIRQSATSDTRPQPAAAQDWLRHPGASLALCGNAIFLIAVGSTILQGLSRLLVDRVTHASLISVGATILINLIALLIASNLNWRRIYLTALSGQAILFALTLNRLSLLNGWQKLEIVTVIIGLILLAVGCIRRLRAKDDQPLDDASILLGFGSLFAIVPTFIAFIYFRLQSSGQSLGDEFALLTIGILMLLVGLTLQLKSPTLCGGTALTLYLMILIAELAYQPQIAIGVYLAAGGLLLFATGIILSIYRDRFLAIPDKIARREGIFRIIDWR